MWGDWFFFEPLISISRSIISFIMFVVVDRLNPQIRKSTWGSRLKFTFKVSFKILIIYKYRAQCLNGCNDTFSSYTDIPPRLSLSSGRLIQPPWQRISIRNALACCMLWLWLAPLLLLVGKSLWFYEGRVEAVAEAVDVDMVHITSNSHSEKCCLPCRSFMHIVFLLARAGNTSDIRCCSSFAICRAQYHHS
jgi:hypothetical protein